MKLPRHKSIPWICVVGVWSLLVCVLTRGAVPWPTENEILELEQKLNAAYRGKTLVLRNFYRGDRLQFDENGALTEGGPQGSWTLYSHIMVGRMLLKNRTLQIEGRRVFLVYEKSRKKLVEVDGGPMLIEAAYGQEPMDRESFRRLIYTVFLSADEPLADFVPPFWKRYCATGSVFAKQPPGVADLPSDSEAAKIPMKPPTLVERAEPPFTAEARKAGYQGTCTLRIVIGTDGKVTDVEVLQPLGMGLDDEAAKAVQKWTFKPATRDGVPVQARVLVNVSFRL